jgi:hypothetical protein
LAPPPALVTSVSFFSVPTPTAAVPESVKEIGLIKGVALPTYPALSLFLPPSVGF